MNYIITNEQHYKDIADAIRTKLQVDSTYTPDKMANAISLIPSTSDGSNELVCGVYFYDPDAEGYPRRYKNVGTGLVGVRNNVNSKSLEIIEFTESCFVTTISYRDISLLMNLREVRLPSSITEFSNNAFYELPSLKKINIPNSLKLINNGAFWNCQNLEFVEIENGFNCTGLDLSCSTKYSRETMVSWFNALKDRAKQESFKFIIGPANLKKLSAEDIAIATAKNWTLA